MKWIKDFVYDHNDLVVALLIIAVAASVIYGRMNLILDYPATVAATSEEAGQSVVDPNPGSDTPTPGGDTPTPGGDTPTPGGDTPNPGGDTPNPGGDTPGGDDNPGGDTPNPGGDTPTPTEYEYVKFKVEVGEYSGWEPLAKGLQNAGIIDDYYPLFKRVLERVNLDGIESYNFYAGTYTLPKGADPDTIIDILRVYPGE